MRTKKPISTISYNSYDFLISKLKEFRKNHVISDWYFIRHYAEEDESKDHFHVLLFPNTLLDTMTLQDLLQELDPDKPLLPLRCIDFRLCNNVDEWILYVLHDKLYLASKMQSREYHYTKDDIVCADSLAYEEIYNHAYKGSKWAMQYQTLQKLSYGVDRKVSPADLVLSGAIPLNQTSQVQALYFLKEKYGTERNGRTTHSPKEAAERKKNKK